MKLSEKLIFKSSQINSTRSKVEVSLPDLYLTYHKEQHLPNMDQDGIDVTEAQRIYNEEHISIEKEKINSELEAYRLEKSKLLNEELEEFQAKTKKLKEESDAIAFEILQEAKEKAKKEIDKGKLEVEQMQDRGRLEVERMLKETEMRTSEIEHQAYQKGYDSGREVGYKEGEAEVQRLVNRLGTIISRAVEIREKLVSDSEKQMIDLVLMIARKIIKDEIIERKSIVLNNIRDALKRIKDQDSIDIRVNFSDIELTAAHKDELIKMMESLRNVNIYEDSRIERGGCIIETDIGAVDVRISTQLKLIEEAIRNAEPI